MGARAWPFGCLCRSPERFGLRNSLRSNSPRPHIKFGTAAQPRPQAPSRGARGWRATTTQNEDKDDRKKKRQGMALQKTEGGIRCRHYRRGGHRGGHSVRSGKLLASESPSTTRNAPMTAWEAYPRPCSTAGRLNQKLYFRTVSLTGKLTDVHFLPLSFRKGKCTMRKIEDVRSRRTFLKNSVGVVGAMTGMVIGLPALSQTLQDHTRNGEADTRRGTPRQTLGPFFPDDGDPEKEIRENLDFRLPISEANDNDLTSIQGNNGKAKGQVVYIRGKVRSSQRGHVTPVPGAVLIEWNASASGRYNHRGDQDNTRFKHPVSGDWVERTHDDNFQYWGRCITDADGTYQFKTIIPGFYPVMLGEQLQWYRPPHLHFMIMAPGVPQLVTQLYFKGDQIPDNDFIQQLNARDGILRSKRMSRKEQESVIIEYKKDPSGLLTDGLVGQYDFVLTS